MVVPDPFDSVPVRRSSRSARGEAERNAPVVPSELSEGLLSLRTCFGRLTAEVQREQTQATASPSREQEIAERQRLIADVWQAIAECERGAQQLVKGASQPVARMASRGLEDKQDTDPEIVEPPEFDVSDTTEVLDDGDGEPVETKALRVLLVDDEPAVLRALARVLSQHYEVLTASNGADALRLVLSGKAPDAIVCDLDMPRLDGSGFFAELRELQPQLLSRVVFCTGKAHGHRAQRLLSGLEAPVLHKPVRAETLLSVVQSVQSH